MYLLDVWPSTLPLVSLLQMIFQWSMGGSQQETRDFPGGSQVFVLTTSATEKHRADAGQPIPRQSFLGHQSSSVSNFLGSSRWQWEVAPTKAMMIGPVQQAPRR